MNSFLLQPTVVTQQLWFKQLPSQQQQLLHQSLLLLEEASKNPAVYWDYSYILLPAAKAYEGFIKDLCFQLGLISEKRYKGHRFRVGKALNPELAAENPEGFETLYDDLQRLCGGREVPEKLWRTWKECRNQTFHYFTQDPIMISLSQARQKLLLLIGTLSTSAISCKNSPFKTLHAV